jgi:dienelactone hydrolase
MLFRGRPRKAMVCPTLFLLCCAGVRAQSYPPGPQVLTFRSDFDDSDQPYALYLPPHFDSARRYPLVLSLHMEESNHRLNLRHVFGRGNAGNETEGEASRRFPVLPEVDFIVACPLARGSMGYRGIAEKDVYDMLADVRRRFPIDDDRVYLTGISMGGGGALWLGLTRPDLWAAIAPVSPDPPPGAEDLAGNALDVPIQLFHGEADPLVPAQISRLWQKRFLQLGVRAEYLEFPGVRHNAWQRAYRNGSIFEWFGRYQRETRPERVRFTTDAYKYASAYWVRLDRFTPGTPASIDARFTAPGRLEVTTKDVDAFTIRYAGPAPLAARIDGLVLRPRGRDSFSFVRTAKGWTVQPKPPAPAGKRAGLEGPIAEAVAGRHIYVYGTADDPTPEILARRRATAATAAEWSTARGRVQVTLAVKADKDLTAREIAESNLILFGIRQNNLLVARFAREFPMELNPSAADYGLVFVAPVGNRYVVVNSGLPWWTGADAVKRSGWRNVPAPYGVLSSFGDFLLFRGGLGHVVAEGRFDSNWKLQADAARQIEQAGAVVISSCCQKSSADTATK